MPNPQSFKIAVAQKVRTHLESGLDPADVTAQVRRRLDTFLSTTPCGPMHITAEEAAQQVICGGP